MVSLTGEVTAEVTATSPYQLNNDQVLRASSALLQHMNSERQQKDEASKKKTLLGDNDDASDIEDGPSTNEPVWLILTTKKHVVDKNRLKPGKICIPHSLNTSPSLSVCLITADPQRAAKDVIADPSFQASLSSRINKVIGYSKLKARYQSFESRRQLLSEHDVFLADDRIIMRLVNVLGKIFYQSSKRPIPVRIENIKKVDGKRVKGDRKNPQNDQKHIAIASPQIVAKEIEKALSCASVHLAPATTAAVRVGAANFTPQQLKENIEAVVVGMTDKFIAKGWRNVKAIHIKGPNTMAMPVWLTRELWLDEKDVLENAPESETNMSKDTKHKKRRSIGTNEVLLQGSRKSKKQRIAGNDDEIALMVTRRENLQRQKAKALEDSDVIISKTAGV